MRPMVDVTVTDALLSSGRWTPEVRLRDGSWTVHETSPAGATVGSNERPVGDGTASVDRVLDRVDLATDPLADLDAVFSEEFGTALSTPLSMAVHRYRAHETGRTLVEFVEDTYSTSRDEPGVVSNLLNGSEHAAGELCFCEVMVLPDGETSRENVEIATQVREDLRELLTERFGPAATLVGREGGFAPRISSPEDALAVLDRAIEARNPDRCDLAVDAAANCFHDDGEYVVDGERLDTSGLCDYYLDLFDLFDRFRYLEDPFAEDDLAGWQSLAARRPERVSVVGDDLTVTDVDRIRKHDDCFDAVILKPNQIGTVTGLVRSFDYCDRNGLAAVVSQRSGETDTPTIVDLGRGLGADLLKIGPPARERIVKHNHLLRQ